MDTLLIKNISKSFKNLDVLNNISIDVQKGEFVSILGPSGCGKSTLFNIIAGLIRPDSGSIVLGDREITGQTGHVGFMHQKDLLLPWKTVIDNVSVPLMLKGMSKVDARMHAGKYLGDFGLEGFERSFPKQLSGGMRQRTALLRTYLFNNDVMLLDEPFGALDAITRRHMQEWLLGIINKYYSTVLLITHDIDEAILLSDRIVVLSKRPAVKSRDMEVRIKRPRGQETTTSEVFIEYKRELLNIL